MGVIGAVGYYIYDEIRMHQLQAVRAQRALMLVKLLLHNSSNCPNFTVRTNQ